MRKSLVLQAKRNGRFDHEREKEIKKIVCFCLIFFKKHFKMK